MMGSENQLSHQPYQSSPLRSVYSVGDVEGVLGPQTPSHHLQGFNAHQPDYRHATPASTSRTTDTFATQYSGDCSLPPQPKRKSGVAGVSANLKNHTFDTLSTKSVYLDQSYSSLVPRSLRVKSSDKPINSIGIPDNNGSEPPPSYSPPRKTSSDDSIINRHTSRRNSSNRKPRSRRDTRQHLADTESDQATPQKEILHFNNSINSTSCYPCGCSAEMSQWSVQNEGTDLSAWSQPYQQHSGTPRNYIQPQRQFHSKYSLEHNEKDQIQARRPVTHECRHSVSGGSTGPLCFSHHCHHHNQSGCRSGHACCNHQNHNNINSTASAQPATSTTDPTESNIQKIDQAKPGKHETAKIDLETDLDQYEGKFLYICVNILKL